MKKIILILISITILSCSKETSNNENDFEFGQIVFQVDYVNYAWGFQHNGFFIDVNGNVFCYDMDSLWSQEELYAILPNEIINGMLEKTNSGCGYVPFNQMNYMKSLIPKIEEGYMKLPRNLMADAGITKFYAFLYDNRAEEYERIVFKQYGDWTSDHSTPEGEELFEILQIISNDLQRN